MDFYKASVIDLKWCVTILYSELLAAALRYRYATPKVFTSSTDINNKIKILWCRHLAR
jgi:hypothetical protein